MSCKSHGPAADAAEALAVFASPLVNPQAMSAAIEATEMNKRLLRNMSILLFLGHDAGEEGNQYLESCGPVFLRLDGVMLSIVLAEEGPGIICLFYYYWRRARKHVEVILCFRRRN